MKIALKTALTLTALSLLVPCALLHAQPPPAARAHPLQGTWEGVQKGHEGKYTITITGNSLHYQGPDPKEWYETTFTLPVGTYPEQLHATITKGPDPAAIGQVVFAIFKIADGTLTIVGFAGGPEDAPISFEGSQSFRYDLQKVQPQKQKTELR